MGSSTALALLLMASPAGALGIQQARDKIVTSTLKYLAIPYLWGGEHPKTGLDCSAFARQVYRDAGLDLPRVARDQFKAARLISPREVLPGDLIFYAMKHPGTALVDHVGVYVGKGYFVHAGVSHGVWVEPITKLYYQARLIRFLRHPGF